MTVFRMPALLGALTNQPTPGAGTQARAPSGAPRLCGSSRSAVPSVSTTRRPRVLRMGATGADVALLQQLLNRRLNLTTPLAHDGDFGPVTLRALRSFQARSGLLSDGIAGLATWLALQSSGVALRDVDTGDGAGATSPVQPKQPVSAGTGTSEPSAKATTATGKPAEAAKRSSPWMRIARAELGTKEVAGSRHNPRILEYHASTTLHAQSDEIAWCSSFVNWVLRQAGYRGTDSAAAASWIHWGVTGPMEEGAILVIRNARAANSSLTSSGNHVGFLVQETDSHYILLGGNQSDQVKESRFRKAAWTLRGCRWPAD